MKTKLRPRKVDVQQESDGKVVNSTVKKRSRIGDALGAAVSIASYIPLLLGEDSVEGE